MKRIPTLTLALVGLLLAACSDTEMPNQKLVSSIDLSRFMGTWYVHGHSPTFMDKEAFSATETYELDSKGAIKTTYRFRKGSLDGKWKTYHPVGKVHDTETNAEWRMKFFGLFSAPYYILYVDPNYKYTVIGHPDRKLAWIMSRSPKIEETQYGKLETELTKRDYQLDTFRRVPHE